MMDCNTFSEKYFFHFYNTMEKHSILRKLEKNIRQHKSGNKFRDMGARASKI